MTDYRPGQRVALTRTHDLDNPPHVGQQGTVLGYEPAAQTVAVHWDDDTVTSVRLANGDGLDILTSSAPIREDVWQQVLATVTARGADDGRQAADAWWRDQTGRSPEQLRGTARRILQALDDDEELDESLAPQYDAHTLALPPTSEQLSHLLTAAGIAGRAVPHTWWRQADWKYRDAFETAVREHAGDGARRTLIPQAGGRDLAALGADQVRIGQIAVFSGEWMQTYPDDGPDFLRTGFVGTLIDRWNGWAVFSCTRQIAEAIVAEQQQQRAHELDVLQAHGMTPQQAHREVDTSWADLRFDGEAIVADQRVKYDDPEAIERICPDADGQYVVMGWNWCWEAVDPYRCDRIVGDLPAPGSQQRFVLLPHTWLRVPHDRLRVTDLQPVPTKKPGTSIVTVALDGVAVAQARSSVGGSHMFSLSAAFGRDDWAGYLAGCQHHGRPASEAQVLDALVTEYQVDQAVRQAEADGGVLTRLLDEDGAILRLRPVWPAPTQHSARIQLGQRLRLQNPHPQGHLWQLWNGAGWQYLASVTGLPTVAEAPARQPSAGQVFAFVIAESLLERLDRAELVRHAAGDGIPLDPQMSDDEIRALLRAAHRERGRQDGLPVDDLPTLSAADGLELGRIAAGGTPAADRPAVPPTPSDPDQPPTH